MMKFRPFSTVAFAMVAVSVLATNEQDAFENRLSVLSIPHRETKGTIVNMEPRTVETRIVPTYEVSTKAIDYSDPIASMAKIRTNGGEECLDSIVRVSLAGTPLSKQTFQYNKSGLPTICNSYLPGNLQGEWVLFSTHEYAYDDMDRIILKASTNYEYHGEDFKYEYSYSDDTSNYTSETFYFYDDGGFVPVQKGEYAFDENGNPTLQIFLFFDPSVQDWVNVSKTTATWDESNRQTSYFYYVWDEMANSWEGSIMSGNCEEYFYTPTGKDSLIKGYVWENGEWFNFQQTTYEYNEQDLCVKDEAKYWNREKQDWSGNDAWGPFGQVYVNQFAENSYDTSGHLIHQDVYNVDSEGNQNLIIVFTDDYTDLGDGNIESHKILNLLMVADQPPMPWNESIERFNKWGSGYYYIGYGYSNGERVPMSEDVRHMDDYNNYLGGEFYGFNPDGSRYGQVKEQFNFPDDFDPSLQLDTPSEGIHWIGGGFDTDDTWLLNCRDTFTWTDGYPVMSGSVNSIFTEDGNEYQTNFYSIDYDTSVLMAGNILFWQDYNKRENFYYYKINTATDGVNSEWASGETEWNKNRSYTDTYYYGLLDKSKVDDMTINPNTVEVMRYDAAGIKLNAPTKGLNIVIYSDGSVKKEFVTK